MNFKVKKVFFNCSISCRCSLRFPHSSPFFFLLLLCCVVRDAWTDIVWIVVASAYFKKRLEFNLVCPKSLISRWNPFILATAFTSGSTIVSDGRSENSFEWSVTFFVLANAFNATRIWVAAVPKAKHLLCIHAYTVHRRRASDKKMPGGRNNLQLPCKQYRISRYWAKQLTKGYNKNSKSYCRIRAHTERVRGWPKHSESESYSLDRSTFVPHHTHACIHTNTRRLIATFGAFNFCLPFGLVSK